MADVKICDRCGENFTKKRQWISVNPVRYIIGVATRRRIHWGEPPEDCYDEYDLCDCCFDSFRRFLRGEATDAVVKE